MNTTYPVLLTCVASQIMPEVIALIRTCPHASVRVVGIDGQTADNAVGSYFCDAFYQAPFGAHPDYPDFILDLVRKEGIRLIFPGSDEEVLTLAKQKPQLAELGCEVTCSDAETTDIAADKYQMLQRLEKAGIPVGRFFVPGSVEELREKVHSWGYPNSPFVIKPRRGRGSRGLKLVMEAENKWEHFWNGNQFQPTLQEVTDALSLAPERLSEFVVMEYIKGDKYSIDCLVKDGHLVTPVIRNSFAAPKFNPPTQFADIVFDRDVEEYAERVVRLLPFDYFVEVEVGRTEDGALNYIETNPRLDATLPITTGAGVNFYHEMIHYALHGQYSPAATANEHRSGMRFFRFWDHTFIDIE